MIKKVLLTSIFFLCLNNSHAQRVMISCDDDSPQVKYGVRCLEEVLCNKNYAITEDNANYCIRISINKKTEAEAYFIIPDASGIKITGGDGRGVIYGCLSLVEDLRNGLPLNKIKQKSEVPHLQFRAIKFNLPWDSYREGIAMNIHTETCRSLKFWEEFLDMMVWNRFNALTLWNKHPFPFMIKPANFPEATAFSVDEMREWKELFSGIFRMAKERGIDTYILNWNIFVSTEFSKAHQVALDNLVNRIHYGNGDTSEIIRRYTRECVTQVLQEYPDLSGIGFTHGEAMRGLTPKQAQEWVNETILEGIRLANRKTKIIHRVPLVATVEAEKVTRDAMEELKFAEGPVWAEIKFNWSHAHSSPNLIKAHGGKLSNTYFEPVPEKYRIAWMARNEDFFCLRWGEPNFVREHIAINTQKYVGGYFVGSEGYIPATDYFTDPDHSVTWKYAFQRQWLFYKIWGRLLYNPATADDVFKSEFIFRFGKKTGRLLEAYSHASLVPLRLASSFDFTWDFSLYSEGFLSMNGKSMDFISIDRQIKQPPADPAYVSIDAYVKVVNLGGSFDKERITPPVLSSMLVKDSEIALDLVRNINTRQSIDLMYEVADIKIWANLGLFYSERILGGIALQSYRYSGNEAKKLEAVSHLEKALQYWDEIISISRPIYKDMPLAAYSYPHDGNNSIIETDRRFHWEKLRPDVLMDIETAKNAIVVERILK